MANKDCTSFEAEIIDESEELDELFSSIHQEVCCENLYGLISLATDYELYALAYGYEDAAEQYH